MSNPDPDGASSRARTHALDDLSNKRPVLNRPPADEGSEIARTLGATLRRLRAEYGMGTRRLSARSAVSRAMITRLEAGQRRPRRSLLANLAYGLCPENPRPLIDELVAAAGDSLAPESAWSSRARRRALDRAILAGRSPLPEQIAVPLGLHQRADAARREWLRLLDQPGFWDDVAAMTRMGELMDLERKLRDQAGPALTVRIGKHEIRAGFG